MIIRSCSSILLSVYLLLSSLSASTCYVYVLMRESGPVRQKEKIGGPIKTDEAKPCSTIKGTMLPGGEQHNKVIGIKSWSDPVDGRSPYAFAFFASGFACFSEGHEPAVIAYFHQEMNTFQLLDLLPFADAISPQSFFRFKSWQEIQPGTPLWDRYITKNGLQPGDVVYDDSSREGQNLRKLPGFLTRVKSWHLRAQDYRFHPSNEVIRHDAWMSRRFDRENPLYGDFSGLVNVPYEAHLWQDMGDASETRPYNMETEAEENPEFFTKQEDGAPSGSEFNHITKKEPTFEEETKDQDEYIKYEEPWIKNEALSVSQAHEGYGEVKEEPKMEEETSQQNIKELGRTLAMHFEKSLPRLRAMEKKPTLGFELPEFRIQDTSNKHNPNL